MKRDKTMHLLLWHRPSKPSQKTGKVPLILRLTIPNGGKEEINLSNKILPKYWNGLENLSETIVYPAPKKNENISGPKENQDNQINKGCPEYQEIISELSDIREELKAHFNYLASQHVHVTAKMMKNAYEGKTVDDTPTPPPTAGMTLLTLTDKFVKEFEARTKLTDPQEKRSPYTLTQWKATRHKLIEYLTYIKTNKVEVITRRTYRTKEQWKKYEQDGKQYDIELSAVTPAFYINFRNYLILTRHVKLGGLAADKQIKNTKQLFTYSVDNEFLTRNPLSQFKCTAKLKKVIPLDYWEIEAIVNKEGLDEVMTETQECFIAMIFSGFVYQDVKGLGPDNIVQDPISGELFLRKDRGKTNIEEMVPILPPLFKLIMKYKNHPYCIENGVLFPIKSNSGFNKYLKILMTACGIKKVLKTHLARHTFAYLMISFNVQLIILSKMMGHASIRSTEKYFDVSMEMIANAMAEPINKMFNEMGQLKVMQRVINLSRFLEITATQQAA